MSDNRDSRFLKVAQELALKTQDMRRGFGCLIVSKGKIIASGRNRKSHPKVPTDVKAFNQDGEMRYFGLHCEVAALLKCDFNVRGMIVYIHGQNVRTGSTVFSGPCLLCQQVLKERGIKKAIFSTSEGIQEIELS